MSVVPTRSTPGTATRFPDDIQLDWDDFPGPWQRWLGLSRWVVLANCVAVCVLIWWLALSLARASLGANAGGSGSDLALSSLILAVTVVASMLVMRLHAVAKGALAREVQRNVGRHQFHSGGSDIDWRTGTASRSAVESRLTEALAGGVVGRMVAVVLCDVGQVRRVEDSLGIRAADEVMGQVGERVTGVVADRGLVGRLDGSVIVVVLDRILSARDVALAVGDMAECLRGPFTLATGHAVSAVGTFGYALADEADDPDRLISNARSALATAERSAQGAIAEFDPEVRAAAAARIELEQDLRGAVERGELDVFYQPLMDVTSGVAQQFEALVRWKHPVRGMVHPAEFLSVAAESNLMADIGAFVLRQAAQQAVQWSVAAGSPVTVSVNVDRAQIVSGKLVQDIASVLDEVGLPPGQIEIEFAERILERDVDDVIFALRQLNAAGVKLSVDDFGTSQASLVRLQRLSMVAALKMDRAFVEGVDSESVDRRIVEAIVSLADDLGLAVVAEGVETSAQASTLGEIGVRMQQGFYHRRPGPAAEMADLIGGQVAHSDHSRPPVG